MAHVSQQDHTWHIQGDLVVEDIVGLLNATRPLAMHQQTVLDFTRVAEVDTSAISFIFEIKRRAQAEGVLISLRNLPSNMSSLMQLYGVDGFVNA